MDELKIKYREIRNNYSHIVDCINTTAKSVRRNPDEIKLVVVTKTRTVELIQAVVDVGVKDLGENYVEEAILKINSLQHSIGINWHMIGHVQSRKSESVCQYFQYIHSLDSVKLAEKISKYAIQLDKTIPVWLEMNVGGEISKSGWNIGQDENSMSILPDFDRIFSLPGIKLLGLMTIPPITVDPEMARPYFRKLRKFQEFLIKQYQLSGFDGLSMGMSADFEIAIQEGATCIRIGQAIFGQRHK